MQPFGLDVRDGRIVIVQIGQSPGKTTSAYVEMVGIVAQLNAGADAVKVDWDRESAERAVARVLEIRGRNPAESVEFIQAVDRQVSDRQHSVTFGRNLRSYVRTLADSGKRMIGPAGRTLTKAERKAERPRWRR